MHDLLLDVGRHVYDLLRDVGRHVYDLLRDDDRHVHDLLLDGYPPPLVLHHCYDSSRNHGCEVRKRICRCLSRDVYRQNINIDI